MDLKIKNELKNGFDTIISDSSTTSISEKQIEITDSYSEDDIYKDEINLKQKIINNLKKKNINQNIESIESIFSISESCFLVKKSILDTKEENIIKLNMISDVTISDSSFTSESEISTVDDISYID